MPFHPGANGGLFEDMTTVFLLFLSLAYGTIFCCGTTAFVVYLLALMLCRCVSLSLSPVLTSGITPARLRAPSQRALLRAHIRASHHSAASRVASTGARAWTASISSTPMWVNWMICKHLHIICTFAYANNDWTTVHQRNTGTVTCEKNKPVINLIK